ncbi:MAG: hypothetical protein EXS64_10705 [Candidatus Latescibacteria bacterium]|nr:hypothetical protein [Candidatus Latescibacterota bacterium]
MRWIKISSRAYLWAALGVSLLAGGCADLPVRELQAARLKLDIARRAEAVRYAPEALAASEGSFTTAQREMVRQGRRFVWFRTYDRVKNLAAKAGSDAVTVRELAVQNKQFARKAAEQAMEQAAAVLEQAESTVDRMPLDRRGHAQVASARVTLAEAGHLLKKEDYETVQKRVDRAVADLEAVRLRIDSQIKKYSQYQEKWRRWVEETLAWSGRYSAHAIVVDKVNHRADLYYGGKLKKRYRVDLGMSWMGDKTRRGDNATPEGKYKVVRKMGPSETRYYRALLLNYPNDEDRRQFTELKRSGQVPRRADIGGLIEIHGHGGRGNDWTQGCVALSNSDMDDLVRYVSVGTPVTIVGYRGEVAETPPTSPALLKEKPVLTRNGEPAKTRRPRRG